MIDRHKIVAPETLEQAISIIENKEVRGYKDVCESCAAEWNAAIAQIKREGRGWTNTIETINEMIEEVEALREIVKRKDQTITYKNGVINSLLSIVDQGNLT